MNRLPFSKRVSSALGAIILCIFTPHAKAQLSGEVTIGALIPPASGFLSFARPAIELALEFGLEKFNHYLAAKDANWSLTIHKLDSVAESLMAFQAANISTVLGPLDSSILQTLIPVATENNQILISYGSTSPDQIFRQIDTIFRLLPDDSNYVPVLINRMVSDAISRVVVVYRENMWSSSLHAEFRDNWPQDGSRFLEGSISYDFRLTDSDVAHIASALEIMVEDAIGHSDPDSVAVLTIGFGETVYLMEAYAARAPLTGVRFYNIENYKAIAENEEARAFADKVQYTILQMVPDTAHPDYYTFVEELSTVTSEPTVFVFAAAESVMLAGLAIEQAGSIDVAAITTALPAVASNYRGLLGLARFNDVGDRATGLYEFKVFGIPVCEDGCTPVPTSSPIPTTEASDVLPWRGAAILGSGIIVAGFGLGSLLVMAKHAYNHYMYPDQEDMIDRLFKKLRPGKRRDRREHRQFPLAPNCRMSLVPGPGEGSVINADPVLTQGIAQPYEQFVPQALRPPQTETITHDETAMNEGSRYETIPPTPRVQAYAIVPLPLPNELPAHGILHQQQSPPQTDSQQNYAQINPEHIRRKKERCRQKQHTGEEATGAEHASVSITTIPLAGEPGYYLPSSDVTDAPPTEGTYSSLHSPTVYHQQPEQEPDTLHGVSLVPEPVYTNTIRQSQDQ